MIQCEGALVTIFAALLPAYFLSIFYRSFLSVIAKPVMVDLGIGPTAFGLLGGVWFVVFAVAQFPIGWALDRLGPRRTVGFCMAFGSLGAGLFAVAPDAPLAMLAMALIGIGCAPVFMASLYLFARTVAPARFALLGSTFIGLGSIGNLVGAGPLAIAAAAYGWRASMGVMAGFFLLATVLAVALIRDPPRADNPDGDGEGLVAGLMRIAGIRALWLIAPVTASGYGILATARGLWVSPYMSDVHGLGPVDAGHAATVMATTMIVGAFVYGWLERRGGRPKLLVAAGTVATAAAFALLALSGADSVRLAVALFGFIGMAGFTYAILIAHGRQFFPAHLLGRGMTAINFFFIAGAALAQAGSGWFIAWQKAQGMPAASVYANLHWIFAAVLMASAAVYAAAPDRPAQTR